ncbi:uncharacterized protein JCM15063_000106 [Sporobolomyces koalae]|uniref:uncharacterized protein n=1 Tax=Sporobolomyces koalae TaxID=500713 RepID=UPI0031737533
MLSTIYNILSGSSTSSPPASTPSTSSSPSSHDVTKDSSPTESTASEHQETAPSPETCTSSAFYRKLVDKGKHSDARLAQIRTRAIRDVPPREPPPEECCGEACGLECVTTLWWEEEKTWRDLHKDWRSIKAAIAAEQEETRRAREEEEALNGVPDISIKLEEEETEDDVMDQITRGWKG